MLFVLPTADLLSEPQSTLQMLQRADVPLKNVAEFVVGQWAMCEGQWGQGYTPYDVSLPRMIADMACQDFLPVSRRVVNMHGEHIDLVRAVEAFVFALFDDIIRILEDMELSSYQLQTLKVKTWLGNSMVVDIVF